MVGSRVQVVGICRWSYPSSPGDFRLTPERLDQARALLYDPGRMEHRLFLLDQVVLPALRNQTDKDFTLVLLLGERLPSRYRNRLLEMVSTVPQIRPVFAEEGKGQKKLARGILRGLRDPDAEAVAEFRLDDDDAVAIDFVEETRRTYADIRPLFAAKGMFCIDYTRGVVMVSEPEGCDFRPISARWWTPGLAIYLRPDHPKSVLDFHHMKLWRRMHTLMYADKAMFVRGIHHTNDSSIDQFGKRSGRFRLSREERDTVLPERFAIDPERVDQIWRRRSAEFLAVPAGTEAGDEPRVRAETPESVADQALEKTKNSRPARVATAPGSD